jgi:hypothetical protein
MISQLVVTCQSHVTTDSSFISETDETTDKWEMMVIDIVRGIRDHLEKTSLLREGNHQEGGEEVVYILIYAVYNFNRICFQDQTTD